MTDETAKFLIKFREKNTQTVIINKKILSYQTRDISRGFKSGSSNEPARIG